MSKLLEHIKELGYLIESTHVPYDKVFLINEDNKRSQIHYTKKTLYILGKHRPSNADEADELAAQGIIVKTTGIEIYDAVFEYSEEDKCKLLFGYGLKTKNYLEGCKAKVGYIETDCGEEWDELENSESLSYCLNTSNIEVGKCKDKNIYCAQYFIRTDIDDYMIVKHYFKEKPNRSKIELIEDISQIEQKLRTGMLSEEFTCWECGNKIHWVDTFNNFADRKEALYDRCCCK